MRSPILVRVLVIIGGVLAGLGLVAGHINREVLDGPSFAAHVDEIRRDDEVASALGRAISTELVLANPDLVALRPLVESVATQVAGGDVLSGPTQLAARTTHRALTENDADSVALRIADAGAAVVAVLNALDPDRIPVSADVSVTLASIGSQDFASMTVAVAGMIGTLAWFLPVSAVVCFVAAMWLSNRRWRTMGTVGWSLVWAAISVGAVLLVGGVATRRLDDTELGGAVARAAWESIVGPLWWAVAVLAVVGAATVLACTSSAPAAVRRSAARARDAVLSLPRSPTGVVVRAVVAVIVGVVTISDPLGLLEPLIVLGGVGLVLFAMTEIATVVAAAHGDELAPAVEPARAGRSRSWRSAGILVAAALVVVAGVVVSARPGRDVEQVVAGNGATICNGHAELCDRPFDEVAYVAAHNAMAVAREPGWFLPEHIDPIPVQLDQGVRALLIDVWSGIPSGGVVRTAPGSYAEALAIAEAELGPEIVAAAQRVADSVAGQADGPEARFLCHGLCETGSTPLLETLADIRGWLSVNPDEVVTLFIEDHVDASSIVTDVTAAGLLPFIHEPIPGQPWPTLAEMIRSGQRLVVMVETGRGGPDAPWLVNGFDITKETPYTFPTLDSFNCEPNRGPDDAPLFQMNHWLSGFSSLVSNAEAANQRDVLLGRAEQCRTERGQIPNFVAVNFVTIGDVFEVVDELNGVQP